METCRGLLEALISSEFSHLAGTPELSSGLTLKGNGHERKPGVHILILCRSTNISFLFFLSSLLNF